MSQLQRVLSFGERTITLIGTAHVSAESVAEVENTIKEIKPDSVAIELDEKRADSIRNKDKYRELDIVKVLRRGEGFLLLANLVLASFQRRMGQNVGVNPGDEMLAAIRVADELNIPTVMADRAIQVTLKRAWAKNSLWGKCKLLATLLSSAFSKEDMSAQDIENIKEKNEMDSMMNELAEYMPVVKEVLIDERNVYLADKIWSSPGNKVVAVLGAGHLDGVVENLEKIAGGQTVDLASIDEVPPKTVAANIIPWIIPVLIVVLFVLGYIFGGREIAKEMILTWIFWNSVCAGVTTIIGAGHPITILAAIISAPLTSLCPTIGCGFVTAIVQAIVCKPKIRDIETLQDDVTFRGFYKNRILRILLIFILSSIGSTIGTFIAGGKMGGIAAASNA